MEMSIRPSAWYPTCPRGAPQPLPALYAHICAILTCAHLIALTPLTPTTHSLSQCVLLWPVGIHIRCTRHLLLVFTSPQEPITPLSTSCVFSMPLFPRGHCLVMRPRPCSWRDAMRMCCTLPGHQIRGHMMQPAHLVKMVPAGPVHRKAHLPLSGKDSVIPWQKIF